MYYVLYSIGAKSVRGTGATFVNAPRSNHKAKAAKRQGARIGPDTADVLGGRPNIGALDLGFSLGRGSTAE